MLDKKIYNFENCYKIEWDKGNLWYILSFKNKKICKVDLQDLLDEFNYSYLDENGKYKDIPEEWWTLDKYYNRFLKYGKTYGYYL